MTHEAHLGDGVHVHFDGYRYWLESGAMHIGLTQSMVWALKRYADDLRFAWAASPAESSAHLPHMEDASPSSGSPDTR